MRYVFSIIYIILLLILSSNGHSSTEPNLLDEISTDETWLLLLGYEDSQKESAIKQKEFFLSGQGDIDPLAELQATITAFKETSSNDHLHAQCRFPARYTYLDRQLNLQSLGVVKAECPDVKNFVDELSDVVFVYVSGYLGNPASYYGHLLVRFTGNDLETGMNSPSLSYGARIPDNENMLVYILKGIFGGYDAAYTQSPYYHHIQDYGESQLRDIWEYTLDLEPYYKDLLFKHAYELLRKKYTYYFFNRNCAYRIARLIELGTQKKLTSALKPWELPQSVIQTLATGSQKVVANVVFKPSRQSRFYEKYYALDKRTKVFFRAIVTGELSFEASGFTSLPLDLKYQIIDVALDYHQYLAGDNPEIKTSAYYDALKARYKLPAKGEKVAKSHPENAPHLGRKPSYIAVGAVAQHNAASDGATIRIRPAYYDALDSVRGHSFGAKLAMGDIELFISTDQTYINSIAVVDIEQVGGRSTGLPGDSSKAWQLYVGAEQESLSCSDCLAPSFRAAYGYTLPYFKSSGFIFTAYAGAGYLGRSVKEDAVFGFAQTAANWRLSNQFTASIRSTVRARKGNSIVATTQLAVRIATTRNTDLRFMSSIGDGDDVYNIKLGFYW